MNIWIFQTGEPLHSDGGNPRAMRAMNLADILVRRGHHVTLWSSAFYHQEKRHRTSEYKIIKINDNLEIRLIPSRGYQRNIGFGRLFDHAQLAYHFSKILKTQDFLLPDVAFVGYPPIEAAAMLLSWLKGKEIPCLLDVKDQWPDIFIEKFPSILRPIAKLAFRPYFTLANRTFTDADGISASSDGYLRWCREFYGKPVSKHDLVTPLAVPPAKFSQADRQAALNWWASVGVSVTTIPRFCFVGSLTASYDFSVVQYVAKRFLDEDISAQFVICGEGSKSKNVKQMMSGLDNVYCPGWIDAAQIEILFSSSIASLVPYRNMQNFQQNTPNKILDALAHGLPIVTGLDGEVKSLIETYEVGLHYRSAEEFYQHCKKLINDKNYQKKLCNNALLIYKKQFDFYTVYNRLAAALEALGSVDG